MIEEPEWASIRSLVETLVPQIAGRRGNLVTGRVTKRDESNGLVWISELGNQAIPIVGLNYKVKYYDTDETGKVNVKQAIVSPVVPGIGEAVVVVLEMGQESLPRCVGAIHGRNWITPGNE
jgi:hypothetical protein